MNNNNNNVKDVYVNVVCYFIFHTGTCNVSTGRSGLDGDC